MHGWDAMPSLRFAGERTRPVLDLPAAQNLTSCPLDVNITRTYMPGRDRILGDAIFRINLSSVPLFVTFLSLIDGRYAAVSVLFRRCFRADNAAGFSPK